MSAYTIASGREVWTRSVDGELLAAPVVEGGAVYFATITGRVYRMETKTGRTAWSKPLRATTAPWVSNGRLFLSRRAGGREVQVVVAAETGQLVAEGRSAPAPWLDDVPRSLDDWKKVWAFEGSRPAILDGVRYVAMGGVVEASDPLSGDVYWSRRHAGRVQARSLGTVALAGPELVLSTRNGELYGLDVDTGYTLFAYGLGHAVAAEPIVARGWIYTATVDGRVIALQVGDPSVDGWHMFGGNPRHNGPNRPDV
jgi:outer membrane protein assembly factor BamB